MTESRNIYFMDKGSIGSFNEHGYKLFTEAFGGMFDEENGIGYISVYGGIGNHYFDSWFTTYSELTANVQMLMNNDKCKSIVLLLNSPGGMAEGMSDCCKYIKEASKKKPITAYITGMACSAAYAIATACNKVYSIESGMTGCCGCYGEVFEVKEETYEKEGFFHKIFRSKNAPRKNASIATDKMAEKEYAEMIDRYGDEYITLVSSNRGIDKETAEKTFGEGRVVSAQYALENGMIDGICSLEECLNFTCSIPTDVGEGEDMDITKMTAEEQREIFSQLCEANPSLMEERIGEAKKAESERVSNLNALRDGSDAVNAIVDAAVADGRKAEDVALDVVKAMKSSVNAVKEQAKAEVLENLAEATTQVITPAEESEEDIIKMLASKM